MIKNKTMQIIDSHVHFWQPDVLRYPWLDKSHLLNKPFLPMDYDAASGQVDVSAFVFVQANCEVRQALDEVGWASGLDERIRAIVAFAPLENGDTTHSMLETLASYQRVKGVRRLIQPEPTGFSIQASFVAGVRALAAHDLSFDICVAHHQLDDVIKLVRQCPHVRFVLNHGGKPNIKQHLVEPWRTHISQLAGFENMWCKISGLSTEADHDRWTVSDLEPYIHHLLHTFGANRLMFGSDFPVLKRAGSYLGWFKTLEILLADLSDTEQANIYHNTAKSFYKLGDDIG